VNPILQSLAEGAKTYQQLRGLVGNPDEILKGLRDRREIVLVTAMDNIVRYSLPIPPPPDLDDVPKLPALKLPKTPSPKRVPYGDSKVCNTCGQKKQISQFGWGRHRLKRKVTCAKCYYQKRAKRGSGMAGSHASSMENVNGATSTGRDSAGRSGDGAVHTGAVC
jgi:hypothetical protein